MRLGDIHIELIQKSIKNVHLSVLPPHGDVRISAPLHLSTETIRLYAISKLPWIKQQQKKIRSQERESRRVFVNKETHYFQGRKYLLRVYEQAGPTKVALHTRYLDLYVKPGTPTFVRQHLLNEWYRNQLKEVVPFYVRKWEKKIGVTVAAVGIKLMKTKWGSCNIEARRIWLNLELAKKPLQCLEYIIVHEMVHLLERKHNARFMAYLDKYMPQWKDYKDELNRLPIAHSGWEY